MPWHITTLVCRSQLYTKISICLYNWCRTPPFYPQWSKISHLKYIFFFSQSLNISIWWDKEHKLVICRHRTLLNTHINYSSFISEKVTWFYIHFTWRKMTKENCLAYILPNHQQDNAACLQQINLMVVLDTKWKREDLMQPSSLLL